MWPWCVGLRGQKSLWMVLKGLKPGKRQAWTPVTSYWCGVEGQEKAVDVALVPWRAGSGAPKEPLDGFRGFEAWQTAGLNASNKLLRLRWRPRKQTALLSAMRRKSQVPHLRWSQAPPRPQRGPGSADLVKRKWQKPEEAPNDPGDLAVWIVQCILYVFSMFLVSGWHCSLQDDWHGRRHISHI